MKKITFLTKCQTWSNFRLGLIVLLFVQSFTLSATDYYVNANSGDDGNNGQSAFNAFRSISRMSSVTLRPGDNVYFMNGTYTRPGSTLWNITESGTENAYITIMKFQRILLLKIVKFMTVQVLVWLFSKPIISRLEIIRFTTILGTVFMEQAV